MKRLFALLMGAALFAGCNSNAKTGNSDAKTASTTGAAAEYEISDNKYVDLIKKAYAALSAGDVDGWMASYADDAFFRWNNGDSLVGKTAIVDYWKKRRTDVIDSITFSDLIVMPVKVNKPQVPGQRIGEYILTWQISSVKYKTNKSMTQRIHTVYHFNDNGKIDYVSQYLDRAPIIAATTN